MFSTQTLFVIGAGASCELGLPAGDALRQHIIDALEPNNTDSRRGFENPRVDDAVRLAAQAVDENEWRQNFLDYRNAAMKMRISLPLAQSIDNYLDAHRGNERIETLGKIGIAHSILEAEKASALAYENLSKNNPSGWHPNLLSSWYIPFIQLLNAGQSIESIADIFKKVSFVVFNYDRCLEGFLLQAITAYYDITSEVARKLIAHINIVHPYGKVGDLPWQGGVSVPFGGGNLPDILSVSRQIRTFTETVDTGVAAKVKSMVREADTIVFMGFGFLDQNMKLLSPGSGGRASRVFATTTGISATDVEVLSYEIGKLIMKPQYIESLPSDLQHDSYRSYLEKMACVDLLKSHWHRLTKG